MDKCGVEMDERVYQRQLERAEQRSIDKEQYANLRVPELMSRYGDLDVFNIDTFHMALESIPREQLQSVFDDMANGYFTSFAMRLKQLIIFHTEKLAIEWAEKEWEKENNDY